MKQMINILIIDFQTDAIAALRHLLEAEDDMTVMCVNADEGTVISSLHDARPDVLITGGEPPWLKEVLRAKDAPRVIMDFRGNTSAECLMTLASLQISGSHGYSNILAEYIRQTAANRNRDLGRANVNGLTGGRQREISLATSDILRAFGIPPHLKGYRYLSEAVIVTINGRDINRVLTKTIYPELAKQNDTTPNAVERAIRQAINVMWVRGNPSAYQPYFLDRPTNGECITTIANLLMLKLHGSEEMSRE